MQVAVVGNKIDLRTALKAEFAEAGADEGGLEDIVEREEGERILESVEDDTIRLYETSAKEKVRGGGGVG